MSNTQQIELSIIGVMIKSPDLIDLISSRLKPTDFAGHSNRAVFEHLLLLSESGAPVSDLTFVSESLRSHALVGDGLNSVRSEDLRVAVDQSLPSSAEFYVDQLIYWSQLRELRALSIELDGRLGDDYVDVRKLCSQVAERVESLLQREKLTTTTIGDAASQFLKQVIAEVSSVSGGNACYWGIPSVDQTIMPMEAGNLILICARPSEGKTAAGTQILMHNAMQGRKGLLLSMEQSSSELAARLLSANTGISYRRMRTGAINNEDLELLYASAAELRKSHVEIFDGDRLTARQIRAVAKLMQARVGVDLIVIDYLQHMLPADRRQQTNEQIGENLASLKSLAKELMIPVVALAQLNRKAEGEKPLISHIKGSGDAEQAADVVCLIHNNRRTDNSEANRPAAWIFAKVRNGSTGELQLTWSPKQTKFLEFDYSSV